MKLSTSTGTLYRGGYEKDEAVSCLAKAGFDAADFSFSESFIHKLPTDIDYYKELRKKAEAEGICFNQAHAPAPSSFADEAKNAEMFELIVSTMKRASVLGAENIVVHPCQHLRYVEKGVPEKLFELNVDFYTRLIPYAEEYDIKVAMENMWQHPGMISHSACSRPEEMIRYVEAVGNDSITCCLDIGHAILVREKPDDFIRALGNKRLSCLHVHDVDGINDSHTMPFMGIGRWGEVMASLAEIDYKGDLTFEVGEGYFTGKPKELFYDYTVLLAKTGRHLINMYEDAKANSDE